MRQNPALKAVILLAFGIWLGHWTPVPPLILLSILLSILPVILVARGTLLSTLIPVALIVGGAFAGQSSIPPEGFPPFECTITGKIAEPPVVRYGKLSFPLKLEHIQFNGNGKERIHGKLWITRCVPQNDVILGKTVQLTGTFLPLRPKRNPGDFDLKAWRERNGYVGGFQCESNKRPLVLNRGISPLDKLKNWMINTADRYVQEDAEIVKGLLLGDRRDIDRDFMEALKVTGLSHLIALSGLHIGFLVAMLICTGAILRLKASQRALFAIIGIILFSMLIPPRGATLRASIIAVVFLSGPMLKRWSSPLNSLGLAALIILCIRPGDLFDAGFQLSFAAAGGMIIMYHHLQKYTRITRNIHPRFIREPVRYFVILFIISLIASLSVFPLTSYYFQQMILIAPLFNLVAVPLLALIYAAAWITTFSAAVTPFLASLFADGLNGLISLWKLLIVLFSEVTLKLDIRLAPVFILIWFITIIYFAISRSKLSKRAVITILLLLNIVIWGGSRKSSSTVQAWFLDVGHGDAAVIRLPEDLTMIVDGGPIPWSGSKPALSQVLDYFNPVRIDLVVATHPEADHIGGLIDVVDGYPVQQALCSPSRTSSRTYLRLREVSGQRKLEWKQVTDGYALQGLPDDYRIIVQGPPASTSEWTLNDLSVVLMFEIIYSPEDTLRLLLTGDIEKRGENAYIKSHCMNAGLLKVPHHGSRSSSSVNFLRTVAPDIAVVSRGNVSETGSYPMNAEIATRYLESGIELHLTSEEGAILCEPFFDGNKHRWRVVDWRKPSFGKWLWGST